MKDFSFFMRTKIIFERGCLSKIADIVSEFDANNIMIVTDKGLTSTDIFTNLNIYLKEANKNIVLYDKVRPNPRDVDAHDAGIIAREEKIELVIALGGGSSMDMAKAVAAMLTNEGGIHDVMKPNKLANDAAPLVCVPTTAGTGSEVTSFAVLTLEEEKRKSSIFDEKVRPHVALVDPELLMNVPSSIAAATGMDALTHAIEAYTCKLATPYTDAMALQSIKYISKHIRPMVHNRTYEDCHYMMLGSLFAGIAFGYSDIAGVHCLAEALGGLYDTPHGVANSIFLPLVFEYDVPSDVERHKDVAIALGVDPVGKSHREICQSAVDYLNVTSADIQIPCLRELGYVNTNDFDKLADMCMKNVSLPSNARKLTKDDFIYLYEAAYKFSRKP